MFRDPIWGMDVYYNVYGYVPNGTVNDARAQSIVTERHIKRHRLTADGLKFQHLMIGDQNVADIEYDIVAPKGRPSVKWVKIRVQHGDGKMIVQELLGPKHLIQGRFFEYLLANAQFHPDLYLTAAEAQKMKDAEMAAKAAKGAELQKLLEAGNQDTPPAEEQPAQESEEPAEDEAGEAEEDATN